MLWQKLKGEGRVGALFALKFQCEGTEVNVYVLTPPVYYIRMLRKRGFTGDVIGRVTTPPWVIAVMSYSKPHQDVCIM